MLLLIGALLLLFPTGAAAQVSEADFDGDGVCDQVFRGPHPEDLSVQALEHAAAAATATPATGRSLHDR